MDLVIVCGAMEKGGAVQCTSTYLGRRFGSWKPLQRRHEEVPAAREEVTIHRMAGQGNRHL